MPFLEMLVYVHSRTHPPGASHIDALYEIIQSPGLNLTSFPNKRKAVEQRITLSFFRELTRVYLQ